MKDYLRLLKFLKPHMRILCVAVIFMALFSVFEKASLGTIIPAVDSIIAGKEIVMPGQKYAPACVIDLVNKINAMTAGSPESRLRLLFWVVGVGAFFLLMREIFSFFKTYFMRDLSERVDRDVKNTIYSKFLSLPLDFYSKNPTGRMVSHITYDATLIRDSITTGLTDLLEQPIQILISVFALLILKFYFNISWLLIVISAVLVPTILYPVRLLAKRLKKLSTQSQEKMGDINVALYETISGIKIVKAFSMEPYEVQKFKNNTNQFYKLTMKTVQRMEVISPLGECAMIACIVIVGLMAGKEILAGRLSPGAFAAFAAAIMLLARPLKRLAKVYSIMQTALAAGKRIFGVLDAESKVAERPGAKVLPLFKNNVIFDKVSFGYTDTEVLKGISLEAKKGDIIAIVGPSGVGKTTLVNLIPRFYDVSSGAVCIDGIDVRGVTLKSLMDNIGIVTQETILFNDTVVANISYGHIDAGKESIINAAKIANAHDFIIKMPEGYDTIIGERGFRLSGGEKQRLSIARAVFKNPPILILDEATSQLDTESEMLVQSAIDRLMKGRTVFVIAHRLSTIKNATRIVVLDKGSIVEQGSHDELIAKNSLYKRLYDMQFRDPSTSLGINSQTPRN